MSIALFIGKKMFVRTITDSLADALKHISLVSNKSRQPACEFTLDLHRYVMHFHTVGTG